MFAGTYDIQSVCVSAIASGLNLSCTFAEGSTAQGCILTVCKVETERNEENSCTNITVVRNRQTSSSDFQVTTLEPGIYTITQVQEIESDGVITTVQLENSINVSVEQPSHPSTTPGY